MMDFKTPKIDYKIPTKIVPHGDYSRCMAVKGIAMSKLRLLEDRLRRSNGMVQQGWQRPITLDTGEIIRCGVSFNTSVVEIYAGGLPVDEHVEVKECFCDCSLSMGIITEVQTEDLEPDVTLYNVRACNKKYHYVFYENIIASDFTQYVKDQKVFLMAYNEFQYNCCTSKFAPTGCSPTKTESVKSSDAWRTTYRIIPFCAAKFPIWMKKRMVKKDA